MEAPLSQVEIFNTLIVLYLFADWPFHSSLKLAFLVKITKESAIFSGC